MTSTSRWLLTAWAAALALLMLGPALGPGYVLSYDMVWVPDLAMRADFLGLGTSLPRAVPSDAVVAVLDEVVPGMLLQKLVLFGALVGGGLGASRLAPPSLVGGLAAVSFYVWNPFVAERLLMGHWPVLVSYAALPWLIDGARRWRVQGRSPARLWFLAPLASLSATGGLATAVVLAVFALRRGSRRANLAVLALVLAANAPWVMAGLLHASSATTDPAGAGAFALSDEGYLPAPLAAFVLGGIWNSEVVLPSRDGVLGWALLGFLVLLPALGARAWVTRLPRRDVAGLVACWGVGWGLAVFTWGAPDAMSWLVVRVPGFGLVRDGSRLLLLCAPLLTALVAQGADQVWRRLARAGALRWTVAAAVVILPVTLMPDAALGLSGRLRPATFPQVYAEARETTAASGESEEGSDGDLLLLPLSSYRQPVWNHDRKVLDPLGRYLTPDYVASDRLVVSGTTIAGEDSRVTAVAHALAQPSPELRARGLAALGIGLVLVDHTAPGAAPSVAGVELLDDPTLTMVRLDGVTPRTAPAGWYVAMSLGWALFGGCGAVGAGLLVWRARRRDGRPRTRGNASLPGSR